MSAGVRASSVTCSVVATGAEVSSDAIAVPKCLVAASALAVGGCGRREGPGGPSCRRGEVVYRRGKSDWRGSFTRLLVIVRCSDGLGGMRL
jgi:hypothetical protein